MIKTQGEAAAAARQAAATYEAQILEIQREFNETNKLLNDIAEEKSGLLAAAVVAILPDLGAVEEAVALLKTPHLRNVRENLQSKVVKAKEEVAKFESNPENRKILSLIDPETGILTLRIAEQKEILAELAAELKKYNDSVVFKNYNKNRENAGKIGFFEIIFFQKSAIENERKQIFDVFGLNSLADCYARFDHVSQEIKKLTKEIQADEKRKAELETQWNDYRENLSRVQDADTFILNGLRDNLRNFLENADYEQFLKSENGSLRTYWGALHAVQKKFKYTDDIREYLRKEMAERRADKQKMDKVAYAWGRKPFQKMPADKTNWLVNQPQAKYNSTMKNLNNIRSTRTVVYEYRDYDYYTDYYYHCRYHNRDFLAFDLFTFMSETRPAYDGFNRMLLEEVGSFRAEHNEAKPDFSDMKSFDKNYEPDATTDEGDANVVTFEEEGDGNLFEESEALEILTETDDAGISEVS